MLKFTKMHGIGNCYIYINCFEEEVFNPNKLSEFVSDFHFGIGSDGLVLIMPSEVADFKMRIFNADGSEAEMCGNATRCVAKYVYENGMTNKLKFTLETLGGIKTLDLDVVNGVVEYVSVDMGEAILNPEAIPINLPGEEIVDREIEVDGKKYNITGVSMGNPHAVVFVDDVDSLNLAEIGPKFENHELFPERINTEFVQIIDNNTVKMRVWERGSGETWACGTGACAVVVACVLNGFCKREEEVRVKLRGGDLKIKYLNDGRVIKKGTATFVCRGEVNVPPIAR
ncbi:MAG TPA: diaminopimelate epimerase [Firmicutes bacterium]|mgnify:CR=1 FL=1|nr:diaminopimelate epimerase [Bacillota bacterium]